MIFKRTCPKHDRSFNFCIAFYCLRIGLCTRLVNKKQTFNTNNFVKCRRKLNVMLIYVSVLYDSPDGSHVICYCGKKERILIRIFNYDD